MSSLMNDLGYVSRIIQSLRNVLQLGTEHGLFEPGEDEAPGLILP